jgi:hypothetical protein
MSGPGTIPQDKEKFTAMAPSKPNFIHIGLSHSVVVCLVAQFTLVMVLVLPSVIVREATI